jgi:hypothetical protein
MLTLTLLEVISSMLTLWLLSFSNQVSTQKTKAKSVVLLDVDLEGGEREYFNIKLLCGGGGYVDSHALLLIFFVKLVK